MKLGLAVSAAVLALGLSAGASWAGADVHQYSAFSPLPITPDATSGATGFDNNTGSSTSTTFYDDYSFTIGGTYDVSLSGNFYNKTSASNITSFDVVLYQGSPFFPGATVIDSTGVQTLSSKGSYSYLLDDILTPGVNYYLEAQVVVPGKDIGKYGLTAIASPVSGAPEPGTWALMFAGVAGVGMALRRGRRSVGQLDAVAA